MTPDLLLPLRAAFEAHFGHAPAAVVRSPGRVNLIGEHTDYNDGFVLPCAIDFHTLVAASPRSDAQVRVLAVDLGGDTDSFSLQEELRPAAGDAWRNYVRGTVRELQEAGFALGGGANLAISGNVPQGAGLSSSAALEVAVAQAFKQLQALHALSGKEMASLAQRAENRFVGVGCGIMDQMISACGQAGHALLIDCRSLALRAVPLPAGMAVLIAHSRVRRGLVDGHYNQRRLQCETAAAHYGVRKLRDLDEATLQARRAGLDEVVFRRARHIVSENQRTLQAAAALAASDLRAMGRLMAASHASMRDDFEITVPAVDALVALLQQAVGEEGGARMTGGGFGGCAVALLPQSRVAAVRQAVAAGYRSPDGEPATVWVCQAQAGASTVFAG